jgi:type III secretion system (T3SS) inner membrane Yop/YscD-like protein
MLSAAPPAFLASLPPWGLPAIVSGVVLLGVLLLVMAAARKQKPRERPCPSCGRIMLPTWTKCRFCGATAAEQRAELEFVSGPLVGQTVNLDRDVTTIGSVAGNTVLLTDTGVSRKHIGIKRVDDGYELADLGSTNGVYVNGEKVARRKLAVGDVIRVGTTEIVFRV